MQHGHDLIGCARRHLLGPDRLAQQVDMCGDNLVELMRRGLVKQEGVAQVEGPGNAIGVPQGDLQRACDRDDKIRLRFPGRRGEPIGVDLGRQEKLIRYDPAGAPAPAGKDASGN